MKHNIYVLALDAVLYDNTFRIGEAFKHYIYKAWVYLDKQY